MKSQTASSLRSWVRFYMIVKIKAVTSELDLSAAGYYNYFTLFDTKKRIEKELKGRKTTTSCCHGCLLAIAVDYSSHRACKRGHIFFFLIQVFWFSAPRKNSLFHNHPVSRTAEEKGIQIDISSKASDCRNENPFAAANRS